MYTQATSPRGYATINPMSNCRLLEFYAVVPAVPYLETRLYSIKTSIVQKVVYQFRELLGVLIQKAVSRIRVQVQLSILFLQHLPHEYAVTRRK